MKIRFITKEQISKAYGKRKKGSTLDIREELGVEDIDNIPQEIFNIIGETLSFIKYINTREDESDENK